MDDAQPADQQAPPPAEIQADEAAPAPAPPAESPAGDDLQSQPPAESPPGDDLQPPPEDTPDDELPKPSRRTLILLITPIVILSTAGTIASAFIPALAARHPLLLIILDARNRMLVLAREVDPVWFFLVGFLRRSLSDPLFYILGRLYGDRGIRWLEKKGGGGALVTLTEGWFEKARYLMVFLFPGAIVCALAGATKMKPWAFGACNIAGTITSLILIRIFSDAISSPVDAVVRFFDRNLVVTTIVSVVLVILSLFLNKLQGKLDPDLDELEDDTKAPPAS